MRRYVGSAVIVVGLAHLLYVVVAKANPLSAIARSGVVNAVETHPEREAAFWSLWFGVFVVTTGALVARLQARGEPAPDITGWVLLGMGLFGGAMMPVSGFWAGIPLGLLILLPKRPRPVTFDR
jgi:hypothetical protein